MATNKEYNVNGKSAAQYDDGESITAVTHSSLNTVQVEQNTSERNGDTHSFSEQSKNNSETDYRPATELSSHDAFQEERDALKNSVQKGNEFRGKATQQATKKYNKRGRGRRPVRTRGGRSRWGTTK